MKLSVPTPTDEVTRSKNAQKTVVVGMSGGVDSSVSALLLKEQGFRVIGLFMKNWEDDGECSAEADYRDVAKVCQVLDIPYYSVNFVKDYWDRVFSQFLNDLKKGITPNPDVLCNREIKFDAFFKKALQFGADFIATGHYCQLSHDERGPKLLRGADSNKDQSYFLYAAPAQSLEKVLFPIGNLPKQTVRQIALEHGLITARKKDSTGICFIGERNFKSFLQGFVGTQKGKFQTLSGSVVGEHSGALFYTLGQRRGLGIGGAGDRWFVVKKDMEKNIVYVEQGGEHPALFADECEARLENTFVPISDWPSTMTAKARYRQPDQSVRVEINGTMLRVFFDQPQRALTPGQSIVLYDGEFVLGGGIIEKVSENHFDKARHMLLAQVSIERDLPTPGKFGTH